MISENNRFGPTKQIAIIMDVVFHVYADWLKWDCYFTVTKLQARVLNINLIIPSYITGNNRGKEMQMKKAVYIYRTKKYPFGLKFKGQSNVRVNFFL